MDFVNSACARAVVAKNQLKNKLVREYRYRLRCLVAELLAFFRQPVRFPKVPAWWPFLF